MSNRTHVTFINLETNSIAATLAYTILDKILTLSLMLRPTL